MKKLLFLAFPAILVFLIAACNNSGSQSDDKKAVDTFITPMADTATAENTETHVSDNNLAAPAAPVKKKATTAAFEYFAPTATTPSAGWPVIFAFDPHARGSYVINKYKNLAEEFGFVLVASNRSRNGQVMSEGLAIYQQMLREIQPLARIDMQRIVAMGFSGGARVAVATGLQQTEIVAVIGAGAGFPELQEKPMADFYYVGMAGFEDFNLNELINNDRILSRSGFQNQLIIFEGDHNWPPVDAMREAFYAIGMKEIFTGNPAFANKAYKYYQNKISNQVRNNLYFDAGETAQRAIAIFDGKRDVADLKKQLAAIRTNATYKDQLGQMVRSLEKEMGMQNNFLKAYDEKDIAWWKKQIAELRQGSDNIYTRRLHNRLLGFNGLLSYMFARQAIDDNNLEYAEKTLDIYRTIEPLNPEHAYLEAMVKMKQNQPRLALEYLQQARILGFSDLERLSAETAFEPLHHRADYRDLLRQ
jgi:hypothetical protein